MVPESAVVEVCGKDRTADRITPAPNRRALFSRENMLRTSPESAYTGTQANWRKDSIGGGRQGREKLSPPSSAGSPHPAPPPPPRPPAHYQTPPVPRPPPRRSDP